MARPRRVDMELVMQAQVVAAQTCDVESLRCAALRPGCAAAGGVRRDAGADSHIAGCQTGERVEAAKPAAPVLRRARRRAIELQAP